MLIYIKIRLKLKLCSDINAIITKTFEIIVNSFGN